MENIDGLLRLVVIMYADDTAIIANSATQLKMAMKGLGEYCKNWQLQVNCSKTKIIIFCKSRSRHNNFTLFGENIELVDDYKYLRIMFNYRGNLKKEQNELLKQSYRAMYSLISRGRKLQLPFDIMLELFQSLVFLVLSYGCEVWGYAMIKEIEILRLKFIKLLLKVKPSTCNAIVYGKTGVYPIKIFIYKRMLGFWGRMLSGKSSKLSNVLYEIMLRLYNDGTYEWPWLVFIKKLLDDAGLSYVWYDQREVNVNWLKVTIDRNLKDQWLQKWNAELQEKSSCSTYRLYKKQYELEPHLMLTNDFRIYTTKLRTNNNKLAVVIGSVTLPPWERYLNWVPDITPPPSRDHGKENLPPPEKTRKLPRKIRPRRRQEKHHVPSSSQTGSQPGTSRSPGSVMRAPVKYSLTSQRPQHPQPPSPAANHNSSRAYLPDHPESRQVYKPARSSIQQDSTTRSRRDSFYGSGLSSPSLQRFHRDSFSGSPSGQLSRKVQLTDALREERIAGGWRPGPVQSHPRAAHPDVRLDIDAALPEADAVSHAERPPMVLEIPESERLEPARRPESTRRRGSRPPRCPHRPRKRPAPAGCWCD